MVRTSPSVLANQRAIAHREAPLSSRRNEAVSPPSSHHRSSQRQLDSYERDESPRRSSSYHEHRPASALRRAEDRNDQPSDCNNNNNNEYSLSHSHSHSHSQSHSSHHRSHTPQHSARALRDKHTHTDEKDVAESYEAEIRRIQELRKQLLMPFSHNPQASSSHSHSHTRRAASPPSVSFDHHSYSKELAAPHRLPYANHADYERERPAPNRQSDPYRLGVSPPHAVSSLSNRRGTEPPMRAPEQHKLQQDRLGLYFGAQSLPVMQRTISDSQRTSNGGDGYLCDVDEDDGEESRKRRESEAAEYLEENENDESDSGSGDDGRAEGQEDEGGAKEYNDHNKVPSLPLQQISSHSPAALIRASVARSPSMGPKSTPAHSPSYDHSAMDPVSPPLPPLPPSQHISSPLRAPVPPFKRSSPPMRGSNGAVPDLPSLSSAVNRNYPASDRASSAYLPPVPTAYPPSNDYSDSVKPSSSPNWAPAYNVPVISRRDDKNHPLLPSSSSSNPSSLPLPPAYHPSALAPSAHTHTAKRVEIRPTYVETDAMRALHATVGSHESSEPPKSCCVVM